MRNKFSLGFRSRELRTFRRSAWAFLFLTSWISASWLRGDEPATSVGSSIVGKSVTVDGSIFRRDKPGGKWQIVKENEPLHSEQLLMGLAGAAVESHDGAVRLSFLGDLDNTSPFPVKENAVILHDEKGNDLAFTLDRGRTVVTNRKTKGPAHVRVQVRGEQFDLTLADPGTSIGLELYGRWPRGVPFTKVPKPTDVPAADLIFIVLKGDVQLHHDHRTNRMAAPPGPAYIEWDNVSGLDKTPHRLEKLPPWAQEGTVHTAAGQTKLELLDKFRRVAVEKSLDTALDEFLNSDNPMERRIAIFGLAASDQLRRLAESLTKTNREDVWDDAVLALRHWLGRCPGQDMKLYNALIKNGVPAAQAEIIMELLHSFSDEKRARPETYELLIDYLASDRLAIRGLACWHLYRLAPAGRSIGYDPLAPKEKREQAVQEWRKLIPPGHLPPKPVLNGK
jgi:hypothetical protein